MKNAIVIALLAIVVGVGVAAYHHSLSQTAMDEAIAAPCCGHEYETHRAEADAHFDQFQLWAIGGFAVAVLILLGARFGVLPI